MTPSCADSIPFFADKSAFFVRPEMATVDAPAAAKAQAIARPMPAPPPVMKTVLPLTERAVLEGEMAGYEALCQVLVGDGNVIPTGRRKVALKTFNKAGRRGECIRCRQATRG